MQGNRVESNQTNKRKNSLFSVQHAVQKNHDVIHTANIRGRTCSCKLAPELVICFKKKNINN